MQILVIYGQADGKIRRLAGPMPIPIEAHVVDGEGYIIADTTTPKSVAELQVEVDEVRAAQ